MDTVSPIGWSTLQQQGYVPVVNGLNGYDTVLYAGEQTGHPVISFTSVLERPPHTVPSATYLRMLGSGLIGLHVISPVQAAVYLSGKPGVLGHYELSELIELLQP